ncbi:MAG: hypothetical protein DRP12_03180, partial [Candidatus Aenigmatarchaeota archaeon]
SEEVKENYKRQRKELALKLAEFAQKHNVSILVPFGIEATGITPEEALEMYREVLPELRKVYKGKLSIAIDWRGSDDWYRLNYSGLDYISPLLYLPVFYSSVERMEEKIEEIINLSQEIDRPVLFLWVSRLADGKFYNKETVEEFVKNFQSLEDIKLWLFRTIFDKLQGKHITGLAVYSVYPARRLEAIEYSPETFFWHSKRQFDLVAERYRIPCEERKDAVRLEVRIDGKPDEWFEADPVFFNPSEIVLDFNERYYYGDRIRMGEDDYLYLENLKSLKAVYAGEDDERVYLMFEFYGKPEKLTREGFGSLKIDRDGDGIYDIYIQLHEGGAYLGELVYEDEEKWVNERFAEEIETAYGDVIEVGIPKSILQTDEIGLKFQVPAMCMTWGGIEIRI